MCNRAVRRPRRNIPTARRTSCARSARAAFARQAGAVLAAQARSTPPVRLPTSATILAASASISASVMVLSRGCSVTAMAIDFLPGSMPWPFVNVEHADACDQLAVDRLRGAHDVGGLHAALDHEGEIALDRLERRQLERRLGARRLSPSARGCVRGSLRSRPAGLRHRALPARSDAIRRNGRARSAGRSGSCRSGRDETTPARPARLAAPAPARRPRSARRAHRPWRRRHRPRRSRFDQCRPMPDGFASARRMPAAAVN